MPEVKEITPEENSPLVSLVSILDATSETKDILSAMYELYTVIRDKDDTLTLETAAVAISTLYDKAEFLLEKIEQTAGKLRAAVA